MVEAYPRDLLLKYKSSSTKSHEKHIKWILLFTHKDKNLGFFSNETIFQGMGGDGGVQTYYSCSTVYRPTSSSITCVRYYINEQKKNSVCLSVQQGQLLGAFRKTLSFYCSSVPGIKRWKQYSNAATRGQRRWAEDCRHP